MGAREAHRGGVHIGIVDVAAIDDPRIADYRQVSERDLLERRGVFVAEGRSVVARLLTSGWGVESVLVTPAALAALGDGLTTLAAPIYVVEQPVMNGTVGYNIHRGCLAIGRRPPMRPWWSLDADHGVLALEAIANADNVGSSFRNAAAFGVGGVLLDARTTDPLYRKAVRTSMGGVFTVPFARTPSPAAFVDALQALGRRSAVVALTPDSTAEPLDRVAVALAGRPVVVVLGEEGSGLSAEALGACTHRARIPMAAGVDSLNVAAAGAIALYALTRH